MQSTTIRQIKAAIRDQAFLGNTRFSCPIGNSVAIRRRKGQIPPLEFRDHLPLDFSLADRLLFQ